MVAMSPLVSAKSTSENKCSTVSGSLSHSFITPEDGCILLLSINKEKSFFCSSEAICKRSKCILGF